MITIPEAHLYEIYHEVYKVPVSQINKDRLPTKLFLDGGESMTRMYLEDVKLLFASGSRPDKACVCYDSHGSVWGIFPLGDDEYVLIGPVQTGQNPDYRYKRIASFPWAGFSSICRCFAKILYGREEEILERKNREKAVHEKELYDSIPEEKKVWKSYDEMFDCVRTGDRKTLNAILGSEEMQQYLDGIMIDRASQERVFQFAVTKVYHIAQQVCGATKELELLTQHYLGIVSQYKSDASIRSGLKSMLYDYAEYIEHYQNKDYSYIVNKAMRYISENIYTQISLSELAAHCFIGESTLQHQFKKETGITITEMINRKKIEKSCYFLKYTSLPCSDIALKMGYCSQSYFTAQFKKEKEISPNQWRKTPSSDH